MIFDGFWWLSIKFFDFQRISMISTKFNDFGGFLLLFDGIRCFSNANQWFRWISMIFPTNVDDLSMFFRMHLKYIFPRIYLLTYICFISVCLVICVYFIYIYIYVLIYLFWMRRFADICARRIFLPQNRTKQASKQN